MRDKEGKRKPDLTIALEPSIEKHKDHIVLVFDTSMIPKKPNTVAVRFDSPEDILLLTVRLMDEAVKVWPEDPLAEAYKNL